MRKITMVLLGVLLAFAMVSSVNAEETKAGMMGSKGMMKGSMMGEGMKGREGMKMGQGEMMGMCPMHGPMMQMMMKKEMLATSDGGVIVMSGKRLQKYDKDLNLKTEVEIKMDMEDMQKTMMQMMDKCPKMKQQSCMMGKKQDTQAKLKCAEEWLEKAIDLHELHMRDPKSTTEASQRELMNQIKKAYDCVSVTDVPPDSANKESEK